MKSRNKDCKKTHESLIGKIIYGFLLFMPLLAIATTSLYAIFNKNAYQSYADYTDTQITEVSLNTPLINGQTYYVNITDTNLQDGYSYEVLNYQSNIREIYAPNETWRVATFAMLISGGRTRLQVTDDTNTQHNYFNIQNGFYFVSNGVNTYGQNNTWYNITR